MLHALALYAGHPALQRFPTMLIEPRQLLDTTIDKYIHEWSNFLQSQVLRGTHYNDRYVYQQLHRNCHPTCIRIFDELRQQVNQCLSGPLPNSFSIPNLPAKLLEIATYLRKTKDFHRTPREMTRPTAHIRQIQSPPLPDSTMKCYLCNGSHRCQDCPKLHDIKNDKRARGIVKRLLDVNALLIHRLQTDDISISSPSQAHDTPVSENDSIQSSSSSIQEMEVTSSHDEDFPMAS